jgi:hypothetical protein
VAQCAGEGGSGEVSASTDPAPEFPLFGGHRWVFWIVALLPAVTLLLSFDCMKNGNWPTPMLLTIMLMACLWEAHAQALRMGLTGKPMLWQLGKRTPKTLFSVALAGLLPLVLIGGLLPNYSCNIAERAKVYNAIQLNIPELQREIEHRASVSKTLKGAGLGLTLPPHQEAFTARSNGVVLEDGVIVLVMKEPPAAVLFTPKLVNAHSGAIEWSCRGYPAKSVPMKCREPE